MGSRDDKNREATDRLLLLLIARPRQGFEDEFAELTRREVDRLHLPDFRSEQGSGDE